MRTRHLLPSKSSVSLALSIVACAWAFQVPQYVLASGTAVLTNHTFSIPPNYIDSTMIKNGSLRSADLATGAVGGRNLLAGAITGLKIKDGSLQARELANESVDASKIANAAIGSAQIANESIGSAKIANGSIGGAKIADESLTMADLKPQTLKGEAFAAGELPGVVTPLKSGQSVHGVVALMGKEKFLQTGVTLPMPSETEFDSYHVAVDGWDEVPAAGCTGSATNPVSAPGFVCAYPTLVTPGVQHIYGWGARCACSDPAAVNDGSKYGFVLQMYGKDAEGAPTEAVTAVWVYTAP